MRLTKRQLLQVIRESILLKEWGDDINDSGEYPQELHNAACPDTAMAFWDAGEHWAMEDENNWINEEQGHRFEIIGPDQVRYYTSFGSEKILSLMTGRFLASTVCSFETDLQLLW